MSVEPILIHVFRLRPGQDLKAEINAFASSNDIEAGWIASCVGSLNSANLRLAGHPNGTLFPGPFEILSLSGTVSKNGCHLHICISDGNGSTTGGHLLDGSYVYTTAEIIICQTKEFVFNREKDPETGYQELKVNKK